MTTQCSAISAPLAFKVDDFTAAASRETDGNICMYTVYEKSQEKKWEKEAVQNWWREVAPKKVKIASSHSFLTRRKHLITTQFKYRWKGINRIRTPRQKWFLRDEKHPYCWKYAKGKTEIHAPFCNANNMSISLQPKGTTWFRPFWYSQLMLLIITEKGKEKRPNICESLAPRESNYE